MADDDRSADSPSLEAPSLGLGRWRRKKPGADETTADDTEDTTATVPVAEPEPLPDRKSVV